MLVAARSLGIGPQMLRSRRSNNANFITIQSWNSYDTIPIRVARRHPRWLRYEGSSLRDDARFIAALRENQRKVRAASA
jgi:hypothetical protein